MKVFVKLQLGILLCIIPFCNFAQTKAIIADMETHEPVEGVVITFENSYSVAISDKDGSLIIPDESNNETNISISHVSYETETMKSVNGNNDTIFIRRKTYLSEEVNISATRVDQNSAVAYSQIEKKEIEKNNLGKDIPYLLNSTPSLVVTSDGGAGVGYSGLRIRGSDATRINVTINGVPVNDAESHQVYWVDLPDFASSVEDIQVQRGIGNSTNGAGAFGGSINIQSSKVNPDPYATVSSSAGSFNTFKNTVMFGSGMISKHFAMEGRLSKITSDGYIDRATSNLNSYYLSGGYYGDKNSLRAVIFSGKEKTYQSWNGVSQDTIDEYRTYNLSGKYSDENGTHFYENQTDNYQQDYYQLLYSHEFSKRIIANIGLHYTFGKGYYEEYKQGENYMDYNLPPFIVNDTDTTTADLVRQLWLSNDFYGMTWSLEIPLRNLNIKFGGAANEFDGRHYGEVIASEVMNVGDYPHQYYFNTAKKTDANAFVRLNYSKNKLNAMLDMQVRNVDYTFTGLDDNLITGEQSESMTFFNPKTGINYKIRDNIDVYGYAGIGHKEPVREDFIATTPANYPVAEEMIDFEIGTNYHSKKFSAKLNYYYMDYVNQLISTGKINDVGEPIRENVKDSYRSGIELEGGYFLSSKINFTANVTFSSNKIEVYDEYVYDWITYTEYKSEYKNTSISFSPDVIGYGVVNYTPFKFLTAGLSAKYVGEQFLDNTENNLRKLHAYTVCDLNLSSTIPVKKIKEITIRFCLYNIFSTEYSSNGYTYSDYSNNVRNDYNFYYPQAKLNWMTGVSVKF